MTALAPGLDAPKADGSCFNCGSHDHFAYTCPEPVRKEPYGAAVFRQRQADKTMHGSGGRGPDHVRPKGGSIVVTKYAPPPPPFPPPPFYPPPPPVANAWGQGGPYPPPAPGPPPSAYGQQPRQPYPSPSQAQPPYQPPYPPANTGYGPPVPPPPHVNGGYGPPPPTQAPPYGQYGQAPYQPPPPPSSYGPPGSYPPPAHPPSYAPPDRAYPQAPSQTSYQGPPPPGYQPPPPAGYPGPGYQGPHVPPPPPPPAFASGYGPPPGPPPPPGTYPPAPYVPNFQSPAPYTNPIPPPKSNWPLDAGGHNNQRNRDRRDRRNDRDRVNKNKQHRRDNNNSQRGRNHREDAASRRPSSTPREASPKSSPAPTDVKIEAPLIEATKAEDAKTQVSTTVEDAESKEDQFDQDQLWDFEKAFVELETKRADPVGRPLAAEWNDMPTIPPAYNAKCIKSEYYDPDNPDAFLASVRDTKHWPALKQDPVFRFRRGMVTVQFSGSHHEYFTYHCSKRIGADELKQREIVPMPSDPTLIDLSKPRNSHLASVAHRHGDFPAISLIGKRTHPEADDYSRDVKRPRTKELDRSPLPRLPPRPSPRDVEVDASPWAPQPGDARVESPHRPFSRDAYSHSPGGFRLQPNGRLVPYDSVQPPRHDSGYHSSSDRHRSSREDRSNKHLSPPPSIRDRDREASRGHDRDGDRARHWARDTSRRDRSRSASLIKTRTRSRTRSPSRSRSRSRSRTAAADSAADSADDMDDLEYELLGMQRPETPERVVYKPAIRRPRVKVNDAFSRRW